MKYGDIYDITPQLEALRYIENITQKLEQDYAEKKYKTYAIAITDH